MMIGLLLMALVLIWAFYRWWNRKTSRFSGGKQTWGRAAIILGSAVATLLVLNVLTEHVGITGPVLMIVNFSLRTIFWVLLARAAILLAIAVGQTMITSPKIDPNGIHAGLINASCGFIGFAAAAIIIFHGLSIVGISLIPLLAGLGVGGLAIALAARPTLENLIGGFMILLDRPYRIGQRVKVKGYYGEVEKIGWRSTRIRLLTGHQTIVPNEEMARLDIENVARRPYIRRKANITITYDTPPEKIEKAVEIIGDILKDHEGMVPDLPPKVYFDEFNSDSLNIVMYYWYHPPEFWDFYAFTQTANS